MRTRNHGEDGDDGGDGDNVGDGDGGEDNGDNDLCESQTEHCTQD